MANDTHTLKIGGTTYDLAAKTWYPSAAITTDFDSQSNITAGFNVSDKKTLHMPSSEFGSMNGAGAFMQFGSNNWKCQLVTGQRGPNYLRNGNASQATPEGLYWRKTGQASSDATTYTWTPWREIVSIDNTGTMKITHLDSTYHYSGGPTSKNQTLTIPYATSFSNGFTATQWNLGENCYIKRYASPYNDGGVDSIQIHGYYSVDVDSEFYVDAPYSAQIRGGNDTGKGELTLTKDEAKIGHQRPSNDTESYIKAKDTDVTLRAENSAEYSQLSVTQKRIQLTGSESIELNSSLCTVPSGMYFRPATTSNTTYFGTSSYYWTYGYITNGYITTVRSTTAYSTNGFYESSDERLKNFGNRISVDLDKISRLKKHYFEWKNEKESGIQIGVSAQEIKELYPELVKENEDGYLTVAYDKLSVVALAAIDELHKKNKELEDRIAKLEAIVNKLIDNE